MIKFSKDTPIHLIYAVIIIGLMLMVTGNSDELVALKAEVKGNSEYVRSIRLSNDVKAVKKYVESEIGKYKYASTHGKDDIEYTFEDGRKMIFNRTKLLVDSFNWEKQQEAEND